jgi:hypothetical protein
VSCWKNRVGTKTGWIAALILLMGVLLAAPSGACAVCYGAEDSPMTTGMNNGILTLLAVVAVVQGGFIALFLSFWHRARRLRQRKSQLHLIQGGAR